MESITARRELRLPERPVLGSAAADQQAISFEIPESHEGIMRWDSAFLQRVSAKKVVVG